MGSGSHLSIHRTRAMMTRSGMSATIVSLRMLVVFSNFCEALLPRTWYCSSTMSLMSSNETMIATTASTMMHIAKTSEPGVHRPGRLRRRGWAFTCPYPCG